MIQGLRILEKDREQGMAREVGIDKCSALNLQELEVVPGFGLPCCGDS
jgi:hypothetical protein